jgi:hypothetical protein
MHVMSQNNTACQTTVFDKLLVLVGAHPTMWKCHPFSPR